jgi:membrane protein implicated in regulation of membrane protease activity
MSGNPRMLAWFATTALVVVVAFAAAIAIGEWWILPVALLAHAVGFVVVMRFIGERVADDSDKPDPVTEARLEEERAEELAQGHNGSRRPGDERRVWY